MCSSAEGLVGEYNTLYTLINCDENLPSLPSFLPLLPHSSSFHGFHRLSSCIIYFDKFCFTLPSYLLHPFLPHYVTCTLSEHPFSYTHFIPSNLTPMNYLQLLSCTRFGTLIEHNTKERNTVCIIQVLIVCI